MKDINVLLIDDDDSLRFNMEMLLVDEGFKVESAANAEKALELVGKNSFDVAIVDIRLPGMNGEEFISEASGMDAKLKYIIHTGSMDYILSIEMIDIGLKPENVFHNPIENLNIFIAKIKEMAGNEWKQK
jgi:DNA-binding NtrC family response regulator